MTVRNVVVVVACGIAALLPAAAAATAATNDGAALARPAPLPAWKAAVLGLVEGVTEYLPISSTGHLHVTERLLDVGTTPATEDAADTYAITIQAGAIAAVLVLYRRRIIDLGRGLAGRSAAGRRVLVALVVAFLPAAATGLLFEQAIKDHLLAVGPIVGAWIAGALAIWVVVPRVHRGGGIELDEIGVRAAVLVGAVQVLALWPGTSRSLVTIVGALAVGLSLRAAVEFSFLLGLVTLGAATVYDGAKNGGELVDTFGLATPLLGLFVAFASAVIAVRWMVGYLERRDLRVFALYRVAIAIATLVLLAAGAL